MPPPDPARLLILSRNGSALLAEEFRLPESDLKPFDELLAAIAGAPGGEENLAMLDMLAVAEGAITIDLLAGLLGLDRPETLGSLKKLRKLLRVRPDRQAHARKEFFTDIRSYLFQKRPAEITAARRLLLAAADDLAAPAGKEAPPGNHSSHQEIFSLAVRAAAALGDMDALLRNALRIAAEAQGRTSSVSPEAAGRILRTSPQPFAAARPTTGAIETMRDLVLGQLARALAETGRTEEASQMLQRIKDRIAFAWSSADVADAMSRRGLADEASRAAGVALNAFFSVRDPKIRNRLVVRLLKPLLFVGQHDLVRKGLSSLTDPLAKEAAIETIVRDCIGLGRHQDTIAYSRMFGEPERQMAMLVEVIVSLAESAAPDVEKAGLQTAITSEMIRTAGHLPESPVVHALLSAALDLHRKRLADAARILINEARRRTDEAESPPTRLDLDKRLCSILALTGFADEADSRLKKLLDLSLEDDFRLHILADMALAFLAAGLPDRAHHHIQGARKILEADKGKVWSAEALADVGVAEILLGDAEAGTETLRRALDAAILKSRRRMVEWDLRVIGRALGCLGRPGILNDLVDSLPDNQDRDFLREVAARKVLGLGWSPCAHRVWQMNEEVLRSEVDSTVAALAVARGIVSDSVRSEMLGLVCDRLLREERHEAAAEVAREIVAKRAREKTMTRIFKSFGLYDLAEGGLDVCRDRIRTLTSGEDRSDYGCGMAEALAMAEATLPAVAFILPLITGRPVLVASVLRSCLLRALFIDRRPLSDLKAFIGPLDMAWVDEFIPGNDLS